MGLFGFGKKEEKAVQATAPQEQVESRYKVLGVGCPKCEALTRNVEVAFKELGLEEPVQHVSDFKKIASYGVMSTPAFVIDEEVKSIGKVLSVQEIKDMVK